MKLSYIFVALLLAGISNLTVISSSFATTDNSVVAVTAAKPAESEITAAITKVQNIGDYKTHFAGQNPSPLTSDVTFYQEYNYLLGLVKTAQNLLADYSVASADQLNEIIAAANDAEIACNLILGINRQPKTKTTVTTVAESTPQAADAATPTQSNTALASAPAKSDSAITLNSDATQDTTTTAGTVMTVSVHVGEAATPATTEPTDAADIFTNQSAPEPTDNSQSSALTLAHTATATVTGCALGTLYIKERRTYRPGRH